MNKKNLIKSRLFNLKKWLLVPEAARYLKILFDEEVSEADVLRLALDKRLAISVDFVNHAKAKHGKVVTYEDVEWSLYHSDFFSNLPGFSNLEKDKPVKVMRSLSIDGERFINLDEKVTTITGIWDLSMIGNERLDIEHRYQMITGGPEVTLSGMDGAFVERKGEVICQIQEKFDEKFLKKMNSEEETQKSLDYYRKVLEKRVSTDEINEEEAKKFLKQRKKNLSRKKSYEDDYFPAGGLPDDGVLVVRTQALIDFLEGLSHEESTRAEVLETNTNKSFLNNKHTFYAKELKIAVEAWTELYEKNPPQHVPQGGHKKYITKWLEEKYSNLGQRARERIATVINPNPKGGASPI